MIVSNASHSTTAMRTAPATAIISSMKNFRGEPCLIRRVCPDRAKSYRHRLQNWRTPRRRHSEVSRRTKEDNNTRAVGGDAQERVDQLAGGRNSNDSTERGL